MPSRLRFSTLARIDPADVSVFGGKACGLADLLRAGANAPAGFAVEATLAPPGDWDSADRAELLDRAAPLLQLGPVAVRSSAVAEDSAARSFAGLFETVLGARTPEDVLMAAERCIASGRAERVRDYSLEKDPHPVGLVVQRQVAARAAGVCFTQDPEGRDRAVLVEAVAGTGEALVSGRAEGERWRVYRSGLGTWEARRDSECAVRVLSDTEAITVASGAVALADVFGFPLDLEWAFDANQLAWLQSRPITAARPIQEWIVERFTTGAQDGPVTVWTNFNLRETMPNPLPPLYWTLWRDVILPAVMEPLFGIPRSSPLFRHIGGVELVHGHLYWNMNAVLAAPLLGPAFPRLLTLIDARAAGAIRELLESGILVPRRLPGGQIVLHLRAIAAAIGSAIGLVRAAPPRRILRRLATCAGRIAAGKNLTAMTDTELVEEIRLLGRRETEPLRQGQQAMVAGFLILWAADRAFRFHPQAQRLLTAGVPGNPTTEISIGIDELIEAARELAPVFRAHAATGDLRAALRSAPRGEEWWQRLDGFLAKFGHRGPGEFDITVPRWSEDATMILDLVRSALDAPAVETVRSRLDRLWQERRAALSAAMSLAPWWQRPVLHALARLVESYVPLREAPKHFGMIVFQRMRLATLELGSRLRSRGVIDQPDDVFFLEWDEILGLAHGQPFHPDIRRSISDRRLRFERYRREPAPEILRSDGVPVDDAQAQPPEPGVLRGTAVSGGNASGPVRVLTAPDPSALQANQILVVEFADPGWTPLFPRVRGLVMEVGGVSCHAAVIARELGIPAVFGVRHATRLLHDGQVVTVDGTQGTVGF